MNSTLVNGLSGDAGVRVEVLVADGLRIGVGDPAHLPLAGAHVRCGHVNARPQKALLREVKGKVAGNLLQLVLAKLLRVDLQARFGAAKRNVDDGALKGHQGGEGLHLVQADVHAVADTWGDKKEFRKEVHHPRKITPKSSTPPKELTSLGGQSVVTVLRPPPVDHHKVAIVALQRKGDLEDGVAGAQHAQVPTDLLPLLLHTQAALPLLHQLVLDDGPAAVVEVLHHVEEAGVGGRLHVRQILGDLVRPLQVLLQRVAGGGRQASGKGWASSQATSARQEAAHLRGQLKELGTSTKHV